MADELRGQPLTRKVDACLAVLGQQGVPAPGATPRRYPQTLPRVGSAAAPAAPAAPAPTAGPATKVEPIVGLPGTSALEGLAVADESGPSVTERSDRSSTRERPPSDRRTASSDRGRPPSDLPLSSDRPPSATAYAAGGMPPLGPPAVVAASTAPLDDMDDVGNRIQGDFSPTAAAAVERLKSPLGFPTSSFADAPGEASSSQSGVTPVAAPGVAVVSARCTHQVHSDFVTSTSQGRAIAPAGVLRRFCSQCGAPVQPTDKFCASCGLPVGDNTAQFL